VLVAACAAVSACGGGGTSQHRAHAKPTAGQALFIQACGACHTLTGHNDPRHQGGDLRDFHATRVQFLQLAGEMPVRRPLTSAQLQSVVAFVMAVEAGRS
jgi:mono/diheme cytochrome c family protein